MAPPRGSGAAAPRRQRLWHRRPPDLARAAGVHADGQDSSPNRTRGLVRVTQDFKLLAAAVNLARLATLGLRSTANGWQLQPA
jgi:hypothetical protein